MAFYRCGGGGGDLTETVLWSNSAPTTAFAAQNITLSDAISNYKYIKFVGSTSNVVNTECSAIYDVDTFKATTKTGSEYRNLAIWGSWLNASANSFVREVSYVDETTIYITNGFRLDSPTTARNSNAIPLQIIGLK